MTKKRNYIGLGTTFHDPSIAILNEHGEVLFAEACERYLQSKMAISMQGMPYERLSALIGEYCAPGADLVFAHSWSEKNIDWLRACDKNLAETEAALDQKREMTSFYQRRDISLLRFMLDSQILAEMGAESKIRYALSYRNDSFANASLTSRHFDHHLSHAAAACYSSRFDKALCLILDGEGEYYNSSALVSYSDGKLKRVCPAAVEEPAMDNNIHHFSLGRFFAMLTQACGFGMLTGEEWKVMGLAPYGKVREDLYLEFRKYLKIDGISIRPLSQSELFNLFELFASIERPDDRSVWDCIDVAATGQKVFETCLFELLNNAYEMAPAENIILGGGCALNSTANGKILENTPFKSLHVFSAPADDGNALGAAQLAYYSDFPERATARDAVQSPYLGSSISSKSMARIKQLSGMKFYSPSGSAARVAEKTAELLAAGNIVGWAQGRAEFGPRALGNRSILADPRDETIKDRINSLIKFREQFRPFAPSILHEFGAKYFKNYQMSPYMERTLAFTDYAIQKVPGVVHVNHSGRVQSVTRELNQKYYDLISEFHKITDVPILLNTSFNVMGKPIINSVEDAIAVFYTTGLNALVIGDEIILK